MESASGARPTTAAPNLGTFSRKSSGLVRELSLWDLMWYGIMAAGALFGLLYVFPTPQYFMPGLSVPVAALIATALAIPVAAVYAGLGSAMPRMGGDYLYQSRAIHPSVGFAFGFAWEVFMWVTFTTTGALVVTTLGLQPLLYNLGLVWGSSGLIDVGNWFAGANGLLVTALVLVVLAFLTTARGMGAYRSIQRFAIVPTVVLSNILLIVLLARSHDSFITKFNEFHQKALGQSDFAGAVMKAANDASFANPAFSWKYTILFLSVAGIVAYAVFGAQGLLGEAKQANNFSKLFKTFVLGAFYVGIIAWVIPTWLFQNAVGTEFMNAYSFAFNNGAIEAPAGATLPSFAMMMTGSPIVMILLSLGFIGIGYYFSTCVFLNMTRVLSAMGMDRTLPEWFSRVHRKYRAPINAAIFYLIAALALNLLYRFVPDVQTTMLFGGAFTGVGVLAVTDLAGVLLAWRAPHIYNTSPVARKKVLGLPLLPVAGAVAFLTYGAVTVANLFVPELGFTTGWSRTLIVLSLLAAFVFYWVNRAVQKRRGVDVDLAFKQIPPE